MDNNAMSNLIRGHVDTIILKAISEGDKYGYEICKEISENSGGQYVLKQPTLYSCLKRLEKQGLIVSYWGTTVTNGGRRHYYSLTDLGRDLFQKNQSQYVYTRTFLDNLISDKPFDMSSEPPQEIGLKLVPTGRKYGKREKSAGEDEAEAETVAEDTAEEFDEAEIDGQEDIVIKAEEEASATSVAERIQEPAFQYDLFDKLKVDVDKNIEEYDAASEMYRAANTRAQEAGQSSVHSAETEDRPENSRTVGFSAESSEFLEVSSSDSPASSGNKFSATPSSVKNTEMESQSYTQSILSETAQKARQILFSKSQEQPSQPFVFKTFESDSEEPIAEAIAPVQEEAVSKERQDLPPLPNDRPETKAEKEYRSILNKLLSTAKSSTAVEVEKQQATVVPPIVQETVSAQKPAESESGTSITTFEDRVVVETDDYSLIPHRQKGNVDFSELQSRMQTEGFKVRTHTKQTEEPVSGTILINKLMFATICIVMAIVAAELLTMYFAGNGYLSIPVNAYIAIGSVAGTMLVMSAILYAVNPKRRTRDRFHFGVSMGLSCILTVLAFVASFAVALLVASQLSITIELFKNVLLPTVLALNMPIGVLIYAILHRTKGFHS